MHRNPPLPPSRAVSISSIFSRKQPVASPPPTVVANIAAIEADANTNPHDVQKQIALFKALLDTNIKAGYDVVIARWEHMCEFDSSNPLVRSDIAFSLYLTALAESGLQASVDAAVTRRDSILSGKVASPTPASATVTSQAAENSSSLDSNLAGNPSDSPPVSSAPEFPSLAAASAPTLPPTSSRLLAQAILARQVARPHGGLASAQTTMGNFSATLGNGLGVPENPVVVTLNELALGCL